MNTFFGKRIIVLLVFLMLLILGPYGDSRVSAIDRGTYKSLKTFSEVLDMVEKNYVEPVETDKLLQGATNGMIKSLDPHSSFMTAEMYKELEVDTRGSFGGIGIEITIPEPKKCGSGTSSMNGVPWITCAGASICVVLCMLVVMRCDSTPDLAW